VPPSGPSSLIARDGSMNIAGSVIRLLALPLESLIVGSAT
jgi:hypothetical protein